MKFRLNSEKGAIEAALICKEVRHLAELVLYIRELAFNLELISKETHVCIKRCTVVDSKKTHFNGVILSEIVKKLR